MWELNELAEITYKNGYVYQIVFDNGMKGDVDFLEYVGKGPVSEPLMGRCEGERVGIKRRRVGRWDRKSDVLFGLFCLFCFLVF